MTKQPVWLNDIERDAWVEKHCRICFQPDEAQRRITGNGPGCPHLARAEQNKLPTPWKRRRNPIMGDTYSCAEFTKKPPVSRRGTTAEETPPMLDVEEGGYMLVPVDNWPDYRAEAKKAKEGDHQ
jgi:hypothetical protein